LKLVYWKAKIQRKCSENGGAGAVGPEKRLRAAEGESMSKAEKAASLQARTEQRKSIAMWKKQLLQEIDERLAKLPIFKPNAVPASIRAKVLRGWVASQWAAHRGHLREYSRAYAFYEEERATFERAMSELHLILLTGGLAG
jgi:hypothetical protein